MGRLAAVRAIVIAGAALFIACHQPAEPQSADERHATVAARGAPAGSTVSRAPAPQRPRERARRLLDAQLSALSSADGTDDALVATFARDAVALVPDARAVADPTIGLRAAIARVSPHATLKSAKVGTFAAGGNDEALWWSAELELTQLDAEPEQKASVATKRVRITELATAEAGWKVIAAAATEATTPMPSKAAPEPIAGATDPGPLAALLAAPAALDQAIRADAAVAVFGTDAKETAIGPAAAHALLAAWKALALSIEGKPREVHSKTWGYVQANVNWHKQGKPFPLRMSALLIAVPGAADRWDVVAVQYAAQ
jgi:hypothetical protein